MMWSFRKGSEGERTAVIVGPNGKVDGEGDAVELKLNVNVNVNKRRQELVTLRLEHVSRKHALFGSCLSLASGLTVR